MSRGPLGHKGAEQRQLRRRAMSREERDRDIAKVMATPEGRHFVWWVLDELSLTFSNTFTGNSETFHREGRRYVGVSLMKEVQRVCSTSYAEMVQEQLQLADEANLHAADIKRLAAEEPEE